MGSHLVLMLTSSSSQLHFRFTVLFSSAANCLFSTSCFWAKFAAQLTRRLSFENAIAAIFLDSAAVTVCPM